MDSLIGKTLGKYQIVELLGRGSMAEVYKAYHPALDRHVAIKILHSFLVEDKNFLDRFRHEAMAAAQLRHPNIVIWSARCSSRHNGNRTATSPAAGFRCTLFAAPASPQEL